MAMTHFSDEELNRLRTDLESDLVERKASGADRSGIRRNLCAFANDLPSHGRPGVILIGVMDEGECASLAISDELMRTLAQMRDDGNILPLPSITVERRVLDGCEIVAIVVEPSLDPPVRYQGRIWVKVGPTVRQATPDEEQRLSERRRAGDLPFDMRPARDATLETLDLDYARTQYLTRAVAQDVLEKNRRPLEQQLRALRLVSGDAPTWGALLGLGRDPQSWLPGAYVQFLRIDGHGVTDPIRDQKALTGRLEDILRRLEELLDLNVSVRTDITSGPRETRSPDYPAAALKQLARNAVMHRSYEGTNAPVRVYWYADRVEIQSPGGLYGKVTPENFGTGTTDYRNPLVAEMMHHLGFAQRFGLGVPLAREELAKNGNPPPEFSFQPTHVGVTVRAAG
jgi:ATP-dependent DNA helicase RecG